MQNIDLIQNILATIGASNELSNKKLLLAYSGGIDSSVLLHLLTNIIKNHQHLDLNAIHINHNLSINAKQWQQHCTSTCSHLGIKCAIVNATITRSGGESLENNARLVRYNAFAATDAEVVILAHHQNDQIETIVSQFLRGSDIHNLAAMQEFSWYKDKLLWRPLLNTTKQTILNYAKNNNLTYIEDESNLDNQYLRNFIRNELLPLIKQRDPYMEQKILATHQNIVKAVNIVDEVSHDDLANCLDSADIINLTKLQNLPLIRQNQVLNLFIKKHGLNTPSQKYLNEFIRQANSSSNKLQLKLKPSGSLLKHHRVLELVYPTSIGSTSK